MATIDLKHIARLARLKLSLAERKTYQKQISSILNYIDQIKQIDTENIKPTFQVTDSKNITRPDQVQPSLSQQSALSTANLIQNGYIVVPQTIKK